MDQIVLSLYITVYTKSFIGPHPEGIVIPVHVINVYRDLGVHLHSILNSILGSGDC